MDVLDDKYGDTVCYVVQGNKDAFWRIQQAKMSEYRTTRWDGLPKIGAGNAAIVKL